MGKALIIAEKPSVASDIAKALGGFKKHDDYFESDEYVISSAVGHLLELIAPEGVEVKRGKWTYPVHMWFARRLPAFTQQKRSQ